MPGLDRTGPNGQGANTGRGLGVCNDTEASRVNRGFGYGLGFGRGRGFRCGYGRGFGFRRNARNYSLTLKEDSDVLQNEINILEAELKELKKLQGENKDKA